MTDEYLDLVGEVAQLRSDQEGHARRLAALEERAAVGERAMTADTPAPPPDLIRHVAIEVRRNRFARTRRPSSFDETVEPTEGELDDARAAIEALREPTEAMVEAGHLTWDRRDPPGPFTLER